LLRETNLRLSRLAGCTVARTVGILKLHYSMAKAHFLGALGLKRNAAQCGLAFCCIGATSNAV
jgi:hypothetical protein